MEARSQVRQETNVNKREVLVPSGVNFESLRFLLAPVSSIFSSGCRTEGLSKHSDKKLEKYPFDL